MGESSFKLVNGSNNVDRLALALAALRKNETRAKSASHVSRPEVKKAKTPSNHNSYHDESAMPEGVKTYMASRNR